MKINWELDLIKGSMKKKGKTKTPIKITKWECPKCGSISLTSTVKGFVKRYYYKCDECGAILYSLEELK